MIIIIILKSQANSTTVILHKSSGGPFVGRGGKNPEYFVINQNPRLGIDPSRLARPSRLLMLRGRESRITVNWKTDFCDDVSDSIASLSQSSSISAPGWEAGVKGGKKRRRMFAFFLRRSPIGELGGGQLP